MFCQTVETYLYSYVIGIQYVKSATNKSLNFFNGVFFNIYLFNSHILHATDIFCKDTNVMK